MIKFEVVTNRRLGLLAETVEVMLNDEWVATGPMFVLPSGLVAQPMQKEVKEAKKATPRSRGKATQEVVDAPPPKAKEESLETAA